MGALSKYHKKSNLFAVRVKRKKKMLQGNFTRNCQGIHDLRFADAMRQWTRKKGKKKKKIQQKQGFFGLHCA